MMFSCWMVMRRGWKGISCVEHVVWLRHGESAKRMGWSAGTTAWQWICSTELWTMLIVARSGDATRACCDLASGCQCSVKVSM